MKKKQKQPLPYKTVKPKPYKLQQEMLYSGMGAIPQDVVPEIKIRYNRGKKFLGTVMNSRDVADFLRQVYERGKLQMQECFIVLFLNSRNEIIGYYKHSVGGITGTMADLRIIFATALGSLATSIILSHNHPSGNLKPSTQDDQLTKKAKEAGKLLDIRVSDHIIMTKDAYFSFADESLL